MGVIVDDLEDDPTLQDLVLSVHHATVHTFQGPATKIIENHLGRAFVKRVPQVITVPPGSLPRWTEPGPESQGPTRKQQ